MLFSILRSEESGWCLAGDIFKCILLNYKTYTVDFRYIAGQYHDIVHSTTALNVVWSDFELTERHPYHYNDVILSEMASQITSLTIVYCTIYSGADQRKHQSSASLAFVRGIRRWPVNSPHKGPVTWKMFPFDDVIMTTPYLNGRTMVIFFFSYFSGESGREI